MVSPTSSPSLNNNSAAEQAGAGAAVWKTTPATPSEKSSVSGSRSGVDASHDGQRRVEEAGQGNSHQHHPAASSRHDHPHQLPSRAPGLNVSRETPCSAGAVPGPSVSNHRTSSADHRSVPSNPSCSSSSSSSAKKKKKPAVPTTDQPVSQAGVPNYPPHQPDYHCAPTYSPGDDASKTEHRGSGGVRRTSQCVLVHSGPSSSRAYENVTLVASASLKSREGGGEAPPPPVPPPRSSSGVRKEWNTSGGPNPPVREPPSSIQYNKNQIYQNHEPEAMKPRHEGVSQSSLPGRLPPRVDSGDNGPRGARAPERDVEGVSRQTMPQRFGHGTTSTPQSAHPHPYSHPHPQRSVPTSLPLPPQQPLPSFGDANSNRVDKSTTPVSSPRFNSLPSPAGDVAASPASRSPSSRERVPRDRVRDAALAATSPTQPSGSRPAVPALSKPKPFVVRSTTPYYNTSTQTELSSSAYAMKTSDPRCVPQSSVQIQVDEAADRRPAETLPGSSQEKSTQARMSREFLPSELDSSSVQERPGPSVNLDVPGSRRRSQPEEKNYQPFHPNPPPGSRQSQLPEEKNYFQYSFEGMKSIQDKYGVGEEPAAVGSCLDSSAFSCLDRPDQASIMRQLSEEFYRNSRLAGAGDKPAHLEQPFRSLDSYGGGRSGEGAYSGMDMHPSHSAGCLSRQLSASQTSMADPYHDLSPTPRSSLRLQGQDCFTAAAPRPLQESKKFKSLSAISHQREASVPVMGRSLALSHESLSPDAASAAARRRTPSDSGRDSGGNVSESPSPASPYSESCGPRHASKAGVFHSSSSTVTSQSRHIRTRSEDSLLSERPAGGGQKERAAGPRMPDTMTADSSSERGAKGKNMRRTSSMKKAYGIFEESELSSPVKDTKTGAESSNRGKSASSDCIHLGQIREEGDSLLASGSKAQRPGESARHNTQGDVSDPARESWRDDMDKRVGRFQNRPTGSEQMLSPAKMYESSPSSSSQVRPARLFGGSFDSGVGSEIWGRADGTVTPSSETPRSPLLPLDNPTVAELKQFQQQAVIDFLQRKTGKFFHSPEPLLSEPLTPSSAASTPQELPFPQPRVASSDQVSDLISKTHAKLAKRADSIRRTSSISSRSSSSSTTTADYVSEVSRSRPPKETEWSRLRSSGSFNLGSNRSSVCSDNTYEDISVFGPASATPRGSVPDAAEQNTGTQHLVGHAASPDNQRSNTDSGVMASPTTTAYQNIPGLPPRRRPPPPPPRSPSPEPGPPPALPPRNNAPRKEDTGVGGGGVGSSGSKPLDPGDVKVDERRVDFKTVLQQCRDHLSPREDAYTAQLRSLDMKFSGLRPSPSFSSPATSSFPFPSPSTTSSSPSTTSSSSVSVATHPSSMSVMHTRTPMGVSTLKTRQPTVPQEATAMSSITFSTPVTPSTTSSQGVARTSSPHHPVSDLSSSSLSAAVVVVAESQLSHTRESPSTAGGEASAVLSKRVLDRDTKPALTSSSLSSAKPPQLPERPPREHRPPAVTRAEHLIVPPPSRSEAGPSLPKDKGVPDFFAKVSDWQLLSPEVLRDRKLVDGHHVHRTGDCGSGSHLKDGGGGGGAASPAGRRRDVPPPPTPSGKVDQDEVVGVGEASHFPPPPPKLLSEIGDHFVMEEHEKTNKYGDDSYLAYRNRGSRQVGTYKRSSSAIQLRPDNQHLKAATDSQALFGDRQLGNQAWNSDSQLQASRKADVNHNGAAPQRPPDRAVNHSADGGPEHCVDRVSGVGQAPPASSASAQGHVPSGRSRDDGGGKVLTAPPLRVEQPRAVHEKDVRENSYSVTQSSRLIRDRTDKTVSPSPSSSSSSLSPGSTSPSHSASGSNAGQRWANAAQLWRCGDDVRTSPGHAAGASSPRAHRVPGSRPAVQQQQQQPRDRPSSASSTRSGSRDRVVSDRTAWQEDASPSESRQRYAEVAPFDSQSRALPGHVRTYSQSSENPPPPPPSRSSSSPYSGSWRENASASHVRPEAIAKVPPRRKTEEQLSSWSDTAADDEGSCAPEEERVVVSHGRQPSQEELECDQKAKELAKEVADSDKKLSDVLSAETSKQRIDYLNGLFTESLDGGKAGAAGVRRHQSHSAGDEPSAVKHISSCPVDDHQLMKTPSVPHKPWLQAERNDPSSDLTKGSPDNDTLVKHKEEVMEKLLKKLELLREEKKGLLSQIEGNKALGKRIRDTVTTKCSNPSERDKFDIYVDDVEKIVRLMLNLSGQLARAENALKAVDDSADPEQKKRAAEKCEGLRTKYSEAKQLKEHIDKRSDTVLGILRQWLSGQELRDYNHYVATTSRQTIHLQQLDDDIALNQQQTEELRKSLTQQVTAPSSSTTTTPSLASSSSSPMPVSPLLAF